MTAAKSQSSVKAAQAMAKQKALEKKAKTYKLGLGELSIFTSQLASLLQAGLPLVSCLEALQDQTEDQVFPHRHPRCAQRHFHRYFIFRCGQEIPQFVQFPVHLHGRGG